MKHQSPPAPRSKCGARLRALVALVALALASLAGWDRGPSLASTAYADVPPSELPKQGSPAVAPLMSKREPTSFPTVLNREWRTFPTLRYGLIGLAALTVVAGLALARERRRRTRAEAASAPPVSPRPLKDLVLGVPPIAVVAVGISLASMVLVLPKIRFFADDYNYLVRAALDPWDPDPTIRVLSTNLLFYLGTLAGGGPAFFGVANGLALLAVQVLWALLLRRGGFSWGAAVTAGALVSLAPGLFYLLRWASGFQQLSAIASVLFALYLADRAASLTDKADRRLAALYTVLAALAGLWGVMLKLGVLVVLVPSLFVWRRIFPRRGAPWFAGPAMYVWMTLAVSAPVLVARSFGLAKGDDGKIGSARAAESAGEAWAYLEPSLLPIGYALGVAAGAFVLGRVIGFVVAAYRGEIRAWLRASEADVRGVLARYPALRRLGLLVLVALWLVPYLLNVRYFSEYYTVFCFIPIAALVAWWLDAALPSRSVCGLLGALGAAALLFPSGQLRTATVVSTPNRVYDFARAVRAATEGKPKPTRLWFSPRCPAGAVEPTTYRELRDVLYLSEAPWGVWWATGWPGLEVTLSEVPVQPAQGELAVGYCRGEVETY